MPKRLNISSNERIDVPDFELAANGFTEESGKFFAEREILDRRNRVLEGFRLQVTNGNELTVWNGNAFDRSGQQINDEDLPTAAQTVTLSSPSTDYYVEVEFAETTSDVDGRAFWDPTFDQASPIPDGKEFSINVSTRVTPSWTVVSPVSTSGFAATSNPNSTRIPLIHLRTGGGGTFDSGFAGAAFSLVFASSVLESDVPTGVTSVRVLDSRLFQIGQTIAIDVGGSAETRTIASNDVDNGILGFVTPLASIHLAGAVVRVTTLGANQFVLQQTLPNVNLTLGNLGDKTPRLFQGNEIRGSGIMQSKEATSNFFRTRDDLNVRADKDYLDFLAAQIREMKFGHPRTDVTSQVPPVSFSSAPRYFDFAGGIQGARTSTITIGNGTTSFGDLNGTTETPFLAAIAQLATVVGGRIFVKQGTYTFSSTVNITNIPVIIEGEGVNNVSFTNNTGGALFNYSASSSTLELEFRNLVMLSGTDDVLVNRSGNGTLVFNNVDVDGQVAVASGSGGIKAYASNFNFAQPVPAITSAVSIANAFFENCSFSNTTTTATISAQFVNSCFYGCSIGSGTALGLVLGSGTSNVSFNACRFSCDTAVDGTAGGTRLKFSDCLFSTSSSAGSQNVVDLVGYTDSSIDTSLFLCTQTGTTPAGPGATINLGNACQNINVTSTTVNTGGTSYIVGVRVSTSGGAGNACNGINVSGCTFRDTFAGVLVSGAGQTNQVIVDSVTVRPDGASSLMQYGVLVDATDSDLLVNNSVFDTLAGNASALSCAGVFVTGSGASHRLGVSNCTFSTLGNASTGSGPVFGVSNSGATLDKVSITGCVFDVITAPTGNAASAVALYTSANVSVTDCKVSGVTSPTTTDPIIVSACSQVVITDNVVDTSAAAPLFGASLVRGIFSLDSSGVTISNNKITTGTSEGVAIDLQASAATSDISVIDNEVVIGLAITTSMYGIRHFIGAGSCSNLRVDRNVVRIGSSTASIGIEVEWNSGCSGSCSVSNNQIYETLLDADHQAIVVYGASIGVGVSVCANQCVGRATGAGAITRSGPAMFIDLQRQAVINDNNVRWDFDANIGDGISVNNVLNAVVCNNFILPSSNVGSYALNFNTNCQYITVVGNSSTNVGFLGNMLLTPITDVIPAAGSVASLNYMTVV